jgi:hypothetical protein
MQGSRMWAIGVVLLTTGALTACGGSAAEPHTRGAVLLSVQPAAGSVDVDPASPIVLEFDRPLTGAAAEHVMVHEGEMGALVAGVWALSEEGRRLTFTPAQPLRPATSYSVHVPGEMHGRGGHRMAAGPHAGPMDGEHGAGSTMRHGMQHEGGHGQVHRFTTAPAMP